MSGRPARRKPLTSDSTLPALDTSVVGRKASKINQSGAFPTKARASDCRRSGLITISAPSPGRR
jgi:hypothetical protein